MSSRGKRKGETKRGGNAPRAGTNPRSRSGCLTCKRKHTKCDETRPACERCTSKGIKCEGYTRQFKWSFKHQPDAGTTFVNHTSPRRKSASNADATSENGSCSTTQNIPPYVRRPSRSPSDLFEEELSISPTLTNLVTLTDLRVENGLQDSLLPVLDDTLWIDNCNTEVDTLSSITQCSDPVVAAAAGQFTLETDDNQLALMFGFNEKFIKEPPLATSLFTDTSTFLISNWFEEVCTVWSGFDSGTNLNRSLAIELWHSSPTVCSALHGMSAAFLSTRLPQMRRPARRFMQEAVQAIQTEVAAVKSQPQLDAIPANLLYSLFCIGTTMCWLDANQLGLPFFKEAKSLLRRLNRQFLACYKKDIEVLSFFSKSLTYCEMLLAAVSDGDPLVEIDDLVLMETVRHGAEREGRSTDGSLHPWTGISELTSRLFAQTTRLCRAFRHNLRQRTGNGGDLETALQQIQEAQRLEEQLLELDFPSTHQMTDTGDERTPSLHLTKVAEAYKLASLLHLYQTFPDLAVLRLPVNSATMPNDRSALWEEWIIPLSLRLVKILEHIPSSSGSRVIQPLLYISASTGLRYDSMTMMDSLDSSSLLDGGLLDLGGASDGDNFSATDPLTSNSLGAPLTMPTLPNIIPKMSLEISQARHFIMGRLNVMEYSLPPRPVVVAKELVKAIWDAYDNEMPGTAVAHWVDIMDNQNLRSLFG